MSNRRRCIFDTCYYCFPVEFGSKIIGYAGAILNSINVIMSLGILVALAVVPAPSPDSNPRNASYGLVNITESSIIYYIVNFPNPATTNFNNKDVTILIIFDLVISGFTLLSSVVLLIGLYKKKLYYLKFSLTAGAMRVALMFSTAVAELPSDEAAFSLYFLGLPIYFLLVIRSAYYNMLEEEDMQRLVVGLVTGHWLTRQHLGRLGIRNETQCPKCGEEADTPLHLIAYCRALEEPRRKILGASRLCAQDLEDIEVDRLVHFARKANLPQFSA